MITLLLAALCHPADQCATARAESRWSIRERKLAARQQHESSTRTYHADVVVDNSTVVGSAETASTSKRLSACVGAFSFLELRIREVGQDGPHSLSGCATTSSGCGYKSKVSPSSPWMLNVLDC